MAKNYKIKFHLSVLMVMAGAFVFAQTDNTTIPNSGFETWTCPSYCEPNSWGTDNPFTDPYGQDEISKSTAGAHVHAGTAAVKMATKNVIIQAAAGVITTGVIDPNTQNIYGGCYINYRPTKLKGWFQYAPSGTDTFLVGVSLFSGNTYGTPIATGSFIATSTVSNWTQFVVNIDSLHPGTPDSLQIIISSSPNVSPQVGSTAYVDDLSLVNCTTMAVGITPTLATCTQSNGSALATATGGANSYSYLWSNSSTATTISGLAPATYTVVATDTNGCTASASAVISAANQSFNPGLSSTSASCNTATGSATSTPGGGTSPYTYLWQDNSTNATLSNVTAGTYAVTVTDNHGCSSTASTTVVSTNVGFTVGVTSTNSSCIASTGSVAANASAGNSPYTYLWNNTATSDTVKNLGPGGYSVTVTDSHGCTSTGSGSVSTASGPSATDSVSNVNCFGDSTGAIKVTVSGGTGNITYNWSNGSSAHNLTNLPGGNYSLTVTDAGNCSFTLSDIVNQPGAPLTLGSQVTNVSCHGVSDGAITITPAGGTSPYSFSGGGNGTGLAAGAYTVTVTDNNGCSTSASNSVTQPNALALSATNTNVACHGGSNGSISVSVTGGTPSYSFAWNGGGGSHDTSGLAAGIYVVTVSDAHGCSLSSSDTITQPSALVVSTSKTDAATQTSNDGTASATVTGGTGPHVFMWSNQATTASISGLAPGTYAVTVSDSLGCTTIDSVTVGVTSGINSLNSLVAKLYPNPANNQLTVEVGSGNSKYQFSIYSVDGRMVNEETVGAKANINVAQLTLGLYTYRIKDVQTGAFGFGKFEIQR